MTILVYGSLVPDITFRVPRIPTLGDDVPASHVTLTAAGGGGNVAVALAAWGFEVRVSGNSVGTDPLGRWTAAQLKGRGIGLPAGYVSDAGVTTPNAILVSPDGERTIVGNDYRSVTWLPVDRWDDVAAVMVDAYSGAAGARVIDEAAERGLPVVATDRTGPETARVSVLLWSRDEHSAPAEAAAIAATGPVVAVTDGAGPVVVSVPDGTSYEITPPPHPARETTGAGDVFAAAVVAGLSTESPVRSALAGAAHTAAAYVAAGRDSEFPPLTRMAP